MSKLNLKFNAICVLIVAMFLLNSNDMFSATGNKPPDHWAKCSRPFDDGYCGKCFGIEPAGKGTITCGTCANTFDAGLAMGITNENLATNQITNVFFPSGNDTTVGTGYIGATVNYNHIWNGELSRAYILCDAIEIDDYDEWLQACSVVVNNNSVAAEFILYPNPIYNNGSNTSIKLSDDYIAANGVQSVTYSLYSPVQVLIATFTPTNAGDELIIPSANLTEAGVYYIVCDIPTLSEQVTLQLMVLAE